MKLAKKLIEVALPLEAINKEAAREKSIRHGHPSTLHLWWARRPLAACRAVLFASLVDDPSSRPEEFPTEEAQETERQRLFRIIEELVKWENSNNETVLNAARAEILKSTDGNPPPVLDPFCGGGSIPLEAQRLGLEAHASDLNPVAVLITKALIEIPPKFAGKPPVNPEARKKLDHSKSWHGAQGLAEDVRYYGQWMRDEAERRIGHLYPKVKLPGGAMPGGAGFQPAKNDNAAKMAALPGKEATVIAWLWARTVKCPNPACGAQMPLVRSFWLSTKAGKRAWIEPVVDKKNKTVRFDVKTGNGSPPEGTVNRRGATCAACGSSAQLTYVRSEGMHGRLGTQLMAVVAEGDRRRVYLDPDAGTAPALSRPEKSEVDQARTGFLSGATPKHLTGGTCYGYGLTTWGSLFTPRQLVALTTFSDLVSEARERVLADVLGARASSAPNENAAKMAAPPSFKPPRGWHSRGYLPHFDGGSLPQMLTFRLADSLPKEVLERWENELATLPEARASLERRQRIERGLDSGAGFCWLARPEIAETVENALLHFDGQRYRLHAWVVMPNHVHALFTPMPGQGLSEILHSWKSYTSNEANRLLGRRGEFWQPDYYDRFIRNEAHFAQAVEYIESNPAKAGLCERPEDWPFASARLRNVSGSAGFQPVTEPEPEAARMAAPPGVLPEGDDRPLSDGGTGATAYADAVVTYLAFALDRLAMTGNALVRWNPVGEKAQHAFGRQALPMIWDFAEPNFFASATGSASAAVGLAAGPLAMIENGQGQAGQLDATAAINGMTKPVVCTDPPYYDNIGYADLSDFFYVWLRRSLGKVYPDLFSTLLTPKAQELIATPYRFEGSKERAERFFEEGLGKAFARMREAQHSDYPMTVFYAFKQAETEEEDSALGARASSAHKENAAKMAALPGAPVSTGWETMLEGLLKSRFAITGTWPTRTEMKTRQVAMDTNALASSIVLVCRPRPADAPLATRREFISALKAELPAALKNLQRGNIAPVDLAQAAIGPGMAVFSRYSKVIEADGSSMRVRTALALINQALDEVLAEQEGEFDPDTRWAVAWFEQFGMSEGPYGVAETLSKAKNTAVNALGGAGILSARGGKVRLLSRDEPGAHASSVQRVGRQEGGAPSDSGTRVWTVMQGLIHALQKDGEAGAAELLRKVGALGETARDLAYRLYGVCERKKWSQEGLAYNSLVIAWPEIVKLARAAAPAETQAEMFGALRRP